MTWGKYCAQGCPWFHDIAKNWLFEDSPLCSICTAQCDFCCVCLLLNHVLYQLPFMWKIRKKDHIKCSRFVLWNMIVSRTLIVTMNLGVSSVSGSRQRRCVTCGGWVCQPTCVARCGKWPLATSSTSHMVTFQLYSLLLMNCCCFLSKLLVTVGSCVHLIQWGREERKMTSFHYFDM